MYDIIVRGDLVFKDETYDRRLAYICNYVIDKISSKRDIDFLLDLYHY